MAYDASDPTRFLTLAHEWKDTNKDLHVGTSLLWNETNGDQHGTFTIASGNSFTISSVLSYGTASGVTGWDGTTLDVTGGGELVLSGANLYTGTTTIDGSTLTLTGAGTAGDGTGDIAMLDNATLQFYNVTGNPTVANDITGAGSLIVNSTSQTITLDGTNDYTGSTTVQAGTLVGNIADGTDLSVASGATYQTGDADRVVGALSGAGSIAIAIGQDFAVQSGSFSGVISGDGSLTHAGTGTLTLSGANIYEGGTTVSEGTLVVTGAGSLFAAGDIELTSQNSVLQFNALDGSQTLSGIISGDGSLVMNSPGQTLTLDGITANTYGNTIVQAGTLALANTGSLGTGTLTLMGNSIFNIAGFGSGGDFVMPHLIVRPNSPVQIITTGGQVADFSGNIMDFFIPNAALDGAVMLEVSGGGDADITGTTVNVAFAGDSPLLQDGEHVVLIDVIDTGTLIGEPVSGTTTGTLGVTIEYDFEIKKAGEQLLATVALTPIDPVDPDKPTDPKDDPKPGPRVNERAKSLVTSHLGGVALATQGGDLAAGQGMANAIRATQGSGPAVAGFGALSGGSIRHKTDSHVDMNSFSLMTGLGLGGNFEHGRATVGAFFEFGTGSYDTYNSFANAASVRGDGDTRYYGGGLLGRVDFTNNVYTEASARLGRITNDYKSKDLLDAMGRRASYDTSSTYYGMHLGAGYVWNITGKSSLDLYGKYFWTHVGGDTVRLSTGDPVKFDDVNSHRTRLGGRFSHAVNEYFSPYIGAAWEHEFDGEAKASVHGLSLGTSKISGSTGIGELGFMVNPTRDLPLFLDFGVQGYTGQRQGVTGSLQLRFEF